MARIASLNRAVSLTLLLVFSLRAPLMAQVDTTKDGRTSIPHDTSHVHKTLFTYRDGFLAAAFVGLTFAMFPIDKSVANRLQDPDVQANQFFNNSAKGFEVIASPGAFVIGGGIYAVGRASGHKDVADFGWHGTEAVLLAAGVTDLLKGVLGRARPYVFNDSNPHDFGFLRGFGSGIPEQWDQSHQRQ